MASSLLRQYITKHGFSDREYELLKPTVVNLSLLLSQAGLDNAMASQLCKALAEYYEEVPKKMLADSLQYVPALGGDPEKVN